MNKERPTLLAMILFFAGLFITATIHAEVMVFKSGKTIEGKIKKRTDKYIIVDVYGVESPYYLDEIESIKSEPVEEKKKVSLTPVVLEKSIQKDKKTGPDMVYEYINRSKVLIKEQRFTDALAEFNKAIKINPDDVRIYTERGKCYAYNFKDLDQAISDFSRAIKIAPNQKDAYILRARAYYRKKEFDKSWQDVHKAESLGHKFQEQFIKKLANDSGRKE